MPNPPGRGRRWMLLVGAALIIAWLGWWALQVGLQEPNARSVSSGYGQFVLAAVGLVLMTIGATKKNIARVELSDTAKVDLLATAVLVEVDTTITERRLNQPAPVPIRWTRTRRSFAPPVGAAVGPRGVPPRFPPLPGLMRSTAASLRQGDFARLHDVYGGLASGRILLIGAPGAGKTTAALLLLREALLFRSRASNEDREHIPVPVMVSLHGWNPAEKPIVDWVASELARVYPLLCDRISAIRLLREGRLSVFFDGLDEISPHLRRLVLEALGAAPFRVVLLTRVEELAHAAVDTPLLGAVALELRSVTPTEAADYLRRCCVNPRPQAWQRLCDHIEKAKSGPVAKAFERPLTLSLVRDAYTPADPADELLDPDRFATEDDIEGYLLDRVVTVAYSPRVGEPKPRYSAGQAHHTLSYLAAVLSEAHTRDFRWWQIDHLPHRAPRSGARRFAFTLFLKCGVITGVCAKPSRFLVPHLRDIFTMKKVGLMLAFGLLGGSIGALTSGKAFGTWSFLGFLIGAGIVAVSVLGVRREYGSTGFLDPWQSWCQDRNVLLMHCLGGSALGGLLVGALLFVGYGMSGLGNGLGAGHVVVIFLAGLTVGFVMGAGAAAAAVATTTFTFAQIAAAHGTPLRLMVFLEDARARHILRVTGEIYQFRHAKLHDRLAAKYQQALRPGRAAYLHTGP